MDHGRRAGHDEPVEGDHHHREQGGEQDEGAHVPPERDAGGVERRELHRLGQAGGHVDGRQEEGERARQPDDLGDVVEVVRPEDLAHRRSAVEEVVHALGEVEHDERGHQERHEER